MLCKVSMHVPRSLPLRPNCHVTPCLLLRQHIPETALEHISVPFAQHSIFHLAAEHCSLLCLPLMSSVMALPQRGVVGHFSHRQTPALLHCTFPQHRHSRSYAAQIRCAARKPDEHEGPTASPLVAVPLAAALAASMALGGALFPEDALAARSGGRVGGSSGFRSAAPRSAPAPRASPR